MASALTSIDFWIHFYFVRGMIQNMMIRIQIIGQRLSLVRRTIHLASQRFTGNDNTGDNSSSNRGMFDDSDEKTRKVRKEIDQLKDKERYPEYQQTDRGIVYDKKPFKYQCHAGKAYVWCSCGRSHKQPFCDGTHRDPHLKINLKPIRWDCQETKEYWFCNCKQTAHPPFCDGTHRNADIQLGQSTIRDHHSPPLNVDLKIKKKK